jgi:hypothetical protein
VYSTWKIMEEKRGREELTVCGKTIPESHKLCLHVGECLMLGYPALT